MCPGVLRLGPTVGFSFGEFYTLIQEWLDHFAIPPTVKGCSPLRVPPPIFVVGCFADLCHHSDRGEMKFQAQSCFDLRCPN